MYDYKGIKNIYVVQRSYKQKDGSKIFVLDRLPNNIGQLYDNFYFSKDVFDSMGDKEFEIKEGIMLSSSQLKNAIKTKSDSIFLGVKVTEDNRLIEISLESDDFVKSEISKMERCVEHFINFISKNYLCKMVEKKKLYAKKNDADIMFPASFGVKYVLYMKINTYIYTPRFR